MNIQRFLLLLVFCSTMASAEDVQRFQSSIRINLAPTLVPQEPHNVPGKDWAALNLHDDFDGDRLNNKIWSVANQAHFVLKESTLRIQSGNHTHKDLTSLATFLYGTASARIRFGTADDLSGNHYQRFGFEMAYLDTHDATRDENQNTLRAVFRTPEKNHVSPLIKAPWGSFHDLRVEWTEKAIRYFVNDKLVHQFENQHAYSKKPIIIQNHRQYYMEVDSAGYKVMEVEVSEDAAEEYDALIDQLGADAFKIRAAARKKLRSMSQSPTLQKHLRTRYETEKDFEVRLSIKDMLKVDAPAPADVPAPHHHRIQIR